MKREKVPGENASRIKRRIKQEVNKMKTKEITKAAIAAIMMVSILTICWMTNIGILGTAAAAVQIISVFALAGVFTAAANIADPSDKNSKDAKIRKTGALHTMPDNRPAGTAA